VEDSELRRSRRLLGLPPVILEPPPPPLRRKLDHLGSFEATGAFDPEQPPEGSRPILDWLKTQTLILGRTLLFQSNLTNAYYRLTQLWNKSFQLGLLPFLSLLSPQEKPLLTYRRRSGPPWPCRNFVAKWTDPIHSGGHKSLYI
jgi:hypothetical protein